ncbi:hypothetical protein ACVTXP_004117, partial [Escherichia coli]
FRGLVTTEPAFHTLISLYKIQSRRSGEFLPKIFTVAICHESLSFPTCSNERSVAYFMASVNAVLKINAIYITLWVLQFLVF